MRVPTITACIVALALVSPAGGQTRSLANEMSRLGIRSVLVVANEAVDEYPVWSPTGDALAVNLEGRWMKVSLGPLTLIEATWRGGQPIGLVKPPPTITPLTEKITRTWEKAGKYGARRIETSDGTVAEFRLNELNTELVITKRGSPPDTLWKSALENCHGLGLSPDERYLAFICELHGVMVTRM